MTPGRALYGLLSALAEHGIAARGMTVTRLGGTLFPDRGCPIGYRAGPHIFYRPNSRLFKPEYVERSQAFFERFGSWTIILARFVPIVRTVATVMAGVGKMRFGLYVLYSVIGGVLWTVGVILAGYWLGHIEFVRKHVEPLIDPILLGVVVLSLLPVTVHWLRARRTPEKQVPETQV